MVYQSEKDVINAALVERTNLGLKQLGSKTDHRKSQTFIPAKLNMQYMSWNATVIYDMLAELSCRCIKEFYNI